MTKPAIIKIHVNKTHGTICICSRALDKIKQHSRYNDYPCHLVLLSASKGDFPTSCMQRKSSSTVYKQTARTEGTISICMYVIRNALFDNIPHISKDDI